MAITKYPSGPIPSVSGQSGKFLATNGSELSWGSPGSNWTLLNNRGTALTGADTITISGINNANKIMILIGGASCVNGSGDVRIRLNNDTANNYYTTDVQLSAPNAYAATQLIGINNLGGNNRIDIGTMSASASSTISGYVMLDACSTSGIKSLTSAGAGSATASSGQRGFISGGYYNSASTISSVSINSTGGNFDAGTIFIYTSA